MTTVLIGAAAVAAFAGQAQATALGPWQQIKQSTGPNTQELAMARTPDGYLHLLWPQATGDPVGSATTLWHMAMPPSGGLQPASPVQTNWSLIANPALAVGPGGSLEAFFGGMRTIDPDDPFDDMTLATSVDGGINWSLQAGDVIAPPRTAFQSDTAVSMNAAGSPVETWPYLGDILVHVGTTAATPDTDLSQSWGCCGYSPNVATDPSSGQTTVAWYSNATGHKGVFAEPVAADGSAAGAPMLMPGTSDVLSVDGRTPLVARPGGGTYIAYPFGAANHNLIKLWKVGDSSARTIGGFGSLIGASTVNLAADSAGRIWVFWSANRHGKTVILARRSNPSVTKFGPVVSAGLPKGAGAPYSLDGNAGDGPLDLFGVMDAANTTSTWYRHIYPGLTVHVKPALYAARAHHSATVKAFVTDAGVPLKGATVRVAGHAAKTNAAGRALVKVTGHGFMRARASRAGYVGSSTRLEVTVKH